MCHTSLVTLDDIVCTVTLVGRDKVWIVDAWQRSDLGHFLSNKVLECRLKDLCPIHCVGHVEGANVPTSDDKVIGVHHGQQVVERNVNVLASLAVCTELDSRCHDNRAVVVGSLLTLASVPGKLTAIGNDRGGKGASVVTIQADEHHASLADSAVNLEVIGGLLWSSGVLSVGTLRDIGGLIDVLATDLIVGVVDIWRRDLEGSLGGSSRGVTVILVVRTIFSVWGHD